MKSKEKVVKAGKVIKIAGVTITHPDKLFYPEDKITKLDVAKYYEKVEKYILPELKGRAISMVRVPNGIKGPRFYQKHPGETFPEYIERVQIREKSGEIDTYITIDALEDIIYLVNLGVLEFHTWNSKIDDIEHPDKFVFDLDPSPGVHWSYVCDIALFIKDKLEKFHYDPIVKTSGNKGLHITMFPFASNLNWETAKAFARSVAVATAAEFPEFATAHVNKEAREGKVFIDYLRNDRGSTTVVAYSTRAKPGAPVSLPVDWKEIRRIKPDQFNIKNIFKRLK